MLSEDLYTLFCYHTIDPCWQTWAWSWTSWTWAWAWPRWYVGALDQATFQALLSNNNHALLAQQLLASITTPLSGK
ncbi:unnamed protein product [Rotaria sp. Silwood1]|nr:unnamed protein product [Rotaria sp. Silwood1]